MLLFCAAISAGISSSSFVLAACGEMRPAQVGAQPIVDAGPADGGFEWQPIEPTRAMLALTLPKDFAPPPDPGNRFADNSAAAALLGRRLFFEPRFAGRLLDGDNDAARSTLSATVVTQEGGLFGLPLAGEPVHGHPIHSPADLSAAVEQAPSPLLFT